MEFAASFEVLALREEIRTNTFVRIFLHNASSSLKKNMANSNTDKRQYIFPSVPIRVIRGQRLNYLKFEKHLRL